MKPIVPFLFYRMVIICCIALAVVLLARQAVITYGHTVQFGGYDLRNHTVGSRLMDAGLDPYFTKWQPGMSERLCDPNDKYDRPMNGVTVTPFVLKLLMPLSRWPYATIRYLWWGVQQLLLFAMLLACLYCYRHSLLAMAGIGLTAALFTSHECWILHSELGQIYMLYAAWMMVLYALWRYKSKRRMVFVIGFWLALGVLLRPLLLLFAVPAVVAMGGRRSKLLLLVAGVASLLLLPGLFNNWQWWPSYARAMQMHINWLLNSLYFAPHPQPVFPTVIEGTTNLTRYRQDGHPFSYLQPISVYLDRQQIWLSRKAYLVICVSLNGVWLLLTYLKTQFTLSAEQMLMLGMLLYVSTEICQPYRGAYNPVMWLPVVLVAVGYSLSGYKSKAVFK